MFDFIGSIVRQIRSGGAGAFRINEREALIEADIVDQLHCGIEVFIGFARKANDEVRGNRDVGFGFAQLANFGFVLKCGVIAFHRGQDAVGTRLHRQM